MPNAEAPSAVVVGAGLAGLTAAIDLVDAGFRVTVLERRPFAGGRTFSFTSPGGDRLDNGQHVFLGCCIAYRALLAKLGVQDQACLQRRLDLRIIDASDGPARLREWLLPAPLHLLPSLLSFPYLSAGEKLAVLRAMLIVRFRALPENESFEDWLLAHQQSANAIARLWDLIVIPTCNAPSRRVSAAMGGFVFREGLLHTRWGGRIGYPRVGLSAIVPEPAVAYLREHGADVRFGVPADDTEADVYVVAAPLEPTGLEEAPIVGLNLWYDRALFDGELMCAIVDGEAFWLFDRSRILGKPGTEHHIAVSISAAETFMDVPRDELAQQVAGKLAKVFPEGRLVRSAVEKVRAATFVPAPGVKRPKAETSKPNVFLAGAWTDTGWPDTMESAVRSGHRAAQLAQDLVEKAEN
ncbi:MAG: FAD-dependent oxidoreductase [Chloroflexi bacterium]|nr:FAD-dependent oxidoreductase [Chloroflexota bacterium]